MPESSDTQQNTIQQTLKPSRFFQHYHAYCTKNTQIREYGVVPQTK